MRAVRQRNLPMVVDADGLWLVNTDPSLVAGESLCLLAQCSASFRALGHAAFHTCTLALPVVVSCLVRTLPCESIPDLSVPAGPALCFRLLKCGADPQQSGV